MDTFVSKHLQGVSRTYAIVIPLLPRPLDDAVGAAYLLMRIVDTLEDSTEISDGERARRLRALDDVLKGELDDFSAELAQPLGDLDAERDLMRDAQAVLERIYGLPAEHRDAARTCARQMIGGVLEMLDRSAERDRPYPANRDAAELREYCYYVAGVVGEMLCAMFAHHLKRTELLSLREIAVELGIGLQLVNILKDALKDSTQGRRYLPAGVDGRISHSEIYRAVLAEARQSLQKGVEFVLALPRTAPGVRSFCGLPIAWGAMTLARAEREGAGAKIGRDAIRSSIELFKSLASDDQALRRWFAEMLGVPCVHADNQPVAG